MAHDPEARELIRTSLRLIVQSEKLLAQLEDHVDLLRTFIRRVDVGTTLRILDDDELRERQERQDEHGDCPDGCTEDHDWTKP